MKNRIVTYSGYKKFFENYIALQMKKVKRQNNFFYVFKGELKKHLGWTFFE